MMKPEPDELELAIRARNGDQAALAELIERLRVVLFALAYAELRHFEDAEDAVAAALYHICCHAAELRDPASMRSWMFTIVRNETHRMRRGKMAVPTSLDEATAVGVDDPSPLLRLDIEHALRQLPRDQANALGLFYLRGWSLLEIARHLARPEGTIKYWLHQGRQRLANEMKGYLPMKQIGKACIVAPEITSVQLRCLTDALKAAGWTDIHNIAVVSALDDLFHMNASPGELMTLQGSRIEISDEGKSKRILYESADKQIQINELFSDQGIIRLVEPLMRCDILLLGERIAGRSAFEFMTLLRAIAPTLPVCLLLEPPVSDLTFLSGWVSGVAKIHTLRDLYSENQLRDVQRMFTSLRTNRERQSTPGESS